MDRIEFDEVQEQYACRMMDSISPGLAMVQIPNEYAKIGWEFFEIDLERGTVEVDDLKEAKTRFMDVFARTVKEWQTERKSHNLSEFTNELNEEEMEALGISPQRYAEIVAGTSMIMNLNTGEYFAGENNGTLFWTGNFNHKWHPPHKYSGNVPPFNELKRLMADGYAVAAILL